MQIVGNRYTLMKQIGAGGMGAVYQAHDRLSGATVALKMLTASSNHLTFNSRTDHETFRLSLAREFRLLASLRHPHIISVLDYGFDAQPYFTMEMLAEAETILENGKQQPLAQKIRLLSEMLQAIAYLHRRGIIHRDLKPANVLVGKDQIRVLDFGLSITRDKDRAPTLGTSGTLAYMAPESFSGGEVSEATDLYAVGVIAYELLLGRHPFDTTNFSKLIQDIISTPPDVSSPDLPPLIAAILRKLLEKDPAQRYRFAGDVIQALGEAIGTPVQLETAATRESFLQAARLVGRAAELKQLSPVLEAAIAGHGASWLIGGESGIGKSRLLEELRTLALVGGANVVRGQAVSEGGSPYLIWRETLRWLAINVTLTPLEESVIKAAMPDIGTLLGHAVPDAPELDPQAARFRFVMVLQNMLLRYDKPLVIMLEDLHWAAEELAVLERLTHIASRRPLLLLGSYREDEAPNLPEQLPGMKLMKLSRFSAENIADLSESMIGATGRRPQVVELLRRETEGNVFFLVEVMRALAEEVGGLDRIGMVTLPSHVLAGGVKRIVHRRLERVPPEARPILRLAAVAGRVLDLDLIRAALNGHATTVDLNMWLTTCAECAVLDTQDNRWRFAHDKLRDGLLSELSTDERRRLHEHVATILEQIRPGETDQTAALAYHWSAAGNTEKEKHYSALAGEQAARSGANRDAVKFLRRALELDKAPLTTADRLRRARWQRALGMAYIGLGRLTEAREQFQTIIASLGWPEPVANGAMVRNVLNQIGRQLSHRIRPPQPDETRSAEFVTAAAAYQQLAELYYFTNKTLPVLHAALSGLNLAERARPSSELAQTTGNMGVMFGILARHKMAESYIKRGLAIAHSLNDPRTLAMVTTRVSLYFNSTGQWDRAREGYEQVRAIFEKIGDMVEWGRGSNALSINLSFACQFERGIQICEEYYVVAERRGDVQQQLWSKTSIGTNLLKLGRLDALDSILELLETFAKLNTDQSAIIMAYGLISRVHCRKGELELARQFADAGANLAAQSPPINYAAFMGYFGIAESYLWLSQLQKQEFGLIPADVLTAAAESCARLKKFNRRAPISLPATLLCYGWLAALQNNMPRAVQTWEQGLAAAQRLKMRHEEAQHHFMLGQYAKKAGHMEKACEIFAQIGASAYQTTPAPVED